jgi:hypothetical protein
MKAEAKTEKATQPDKYPTQSIHPLYQREREEKSFPSALPIHTIPTPFIFIVIFVSSKASLARSLALPAVM